MSDPINWFRVAEARKRGKYGRMLPGDQELCDRALKADPRRYREMQKQILAEVAEEMRSMFSRSLEGGDDDE